MQRPKLSAFLEVPEGQLCENHLEVGSSVLADGAYIDWTGLDPDVKVSLSQVKKIWVCSFCARELVMREEAKAQARRKDQEARSRRRSSQHRAKARQLQQAFSQDEAAEEPKGTPLSWIAQAKQADNDLLERIDRLTG